MTDVRARVLVSLVAAGLLLTSLPVHAQTEGMDRRQERRGRRDDARATRQTGRHEARDAKQECREGGGSGVKCRNEKRVDKHESRQKSRDVRMGNE